MKHLYVKYNRERLPKFQLQTTIYKDGIVTKKALSESAKKHLYSIYQNYLKITEKFPNVGIVEAKLDNDKLTFSYIEGKNLEILMVEAAIDKNKGKFFELLNTYFDYIIKFFVEHSNEIKLIEEFSEQLDFNQNNRITNIDIVFSNIILDNSGKPTLIDYEWVFPIELPMNFVIYRAIRIFFDHYNQYMKEFLQPGDLYDFFNIELNDIKKFTLLDAAFQDYVFGKQRMYAVNKPKNSTIDLNEVIREIYQDKITKLYIDTGLGYSEEQSCVSFVNISESSFELNFSLIDFKGQIIRALRWDPVEQKICRVMLNSVWYVDTLGNRVELSPTDILTNGYIDKTNELIIFNTFDPMIIFENISNSVAKFYISGELEILRNHEFEQNEINSLNIELEKQIKKKQELETNLFNQTMENQQLRNQLWQLESTITRKTQLLRQSNEDILKLQKTINNIISSKSWRLTKGLRNISKSIKAFVRKE